MVRGKEWERKYWVTECNEQLWRVKGGEEGLREDGEMK